jgi:hypothetical protein
MPFIETEESKLITQAEASRREERKKLLENRPNLRISINTDDLKRIINYSMFKCARDSSVARNEAIMGSDIDGGLVITDKKISRRQRLSFINELRSMGFSVYDISEYQQAERTLTNFVKQCRGSFNPEQLNKLHELVSQKVDAQCGLIHFFSEAEIKKFKIFGFPETGIKQIYFHGYSIQ